MFNFVVSPELFVLSAGTIVFLCIMWWWHVKKNIEFDVKDIFIDGRSKRFSLAKLGQFVAMLVSTWIIIYQTRHGLLTEWLFTGYMVAWAGANIAGKWLDIKQQNVGANNYDTQGKRTVAYHEDKDENFERKW